MPENAAAGPSPEWTERLTRQLIAMRRQGLRNAEIARRLAVTEGELAYHIGRLIRDGVLTSRRGLLWSHPDSLVAGHERRPRDVAADVARLYRAGYYHRQIASELHLTNAQVHNILTGLFGAGLRKRPPRTLSEDQVRSIHARYLAGGSIVLLAAQAGFSGTAVRRRMRELSLPLRDQLRGATGDGELLTSR